MTREILEFWNSPRRQREEQKNPQDVCESLQPKHSRSSLSTPSSSSRYFLPSLNINMQSPSILSPPSVLHHQPNNHSTNINSPPVTITLLITRTHPPHMPLHNPNMPKALDSSSESMMLRHKWDCTSWVM